MSTTKLKKQLEKERQAIVAHNKKAIDDLLDTVGGVSELATILNIGYTTVKSWGDRGRISKAGAKLVSEHMMLAPYYSEVDLRLDLADKQ
tara:strand:- start:319 stop:588 length:270 start_codon:yes stop_codon:yes gene_type:complete